MNKKEMLILIASQNYPMLLTDGKILVQTLGTGAGYIQHEGCCFYTPKLFSTLFDLIDPESGGEFEGEEVTLEQTHFCYERVKPGFYIVDGGLYVDGYFHKTSDPILIINAWYGGQDIDEHRLKELAAEWVKGARPDGSRGDADEFHK